MEAAKFWHIGVVVEQLEAAMEELSRGLGMEWTDVREHTMMGCPLRTAFSTNGPPYLELIEGPEGTEWDSTLGSRIHHLTYWTDDLSEERRRLEDAGFPVVVDGQARGMPVNYHAFERAGMRIEAFDTAAKSRLPAGLQDWADPPSRRRG